MHTGKSPSNSKYQGEPLDESTMLNSSLQQPSHDIMGGASVDSALASGVRATSLVAAGNYATSVSPTYALPDLVQRQGSRNVYLHKGHGGLVGLNALASGAAAVGARAPPGGLQGLQGSGLRRAPFLLHTDRAKNSVEPAQAGTQAPTQKGRDSIESSPPLAVTGKKPNAAHSGTK